jgi:predicted Zn-dependent protease
MLAGLRVAIVACVVAACGSGPSGPALTFDPCQPVVLAAPSVTADQRASIDDAIELWSAAGVTTLSVGDGPQLTVEFKSAAAVVYGYYDDTTATVYVNTEVTDAGQRAIVLAHELGHALGLDHVDDAAAIMYRLNQSSNEVPTAADMQDLARVCRT